MIKIKSLDDYFISGCGGQWVGEKRTRGTVRDREKPGILLLPSYDLRVNSPNFHMWGGWELGGHLSLAHTTIREMTLPTS